MATQPDMMTAGGQTASFAPVRVPVDYSQNTNATLFMNSNASFTNDGANRYTIDRNVAPGANFQHQQPYFQQPMYQYPGYYQQQYIAPQTYMPQMQMVPPQAPMPQQPAPPRQRNVLKIEDPNTHEEVNIVGNGAASAAPSTTVDPVVEVERQKVARRKEIQEHLRSQIGATTAVKPKEAEEAVAEVKEELPAPVVQETPEPEPPVAPEPVKEEPVPEPVEETKAEAVPVVVEAPVKALVKEEEPAVEAVAEPEAVAEITASLEKVTVEEKVETAINPESPDIPSLQVNPADEDIPSPSVVVEAPDAEEEAVSPSPDAEEEERRREEEEAARIRQREAELDALHAELLQNKEEVDITIGFYNRAFLYCVRDIEKEFKRTNCPLTADQLKGYGLDIHSMPKSSGDGKKGRPDFNPPWAQRSSMQGRVGGSNRQYSGRNSHDHRGGRGGGGAGKKPYGPRISIDRPAERKVTLGNRAENAWKPEKISAEDMEKEENRIKLLLKSVRSLLNKITPTTKDDLMKEWLALQVSGAKFDASQEQLGEVVNIMFDKAVEEPKFCSLYSEICKRQVDHEVKYSEKKASVFRNALLNRAQTTFVNKTMDDNKKALDEETDEIKKKQMEIEYQEAYNKFRRRKFGNINFIGQLYGQHLLSTKIIQWCLFDLMRHSHPDAAGNLPAPPYDEESLMCATQLIEAVGRSFETCQDFGGAKEYLSQLFQHLTKLAPNCTPKIKFKIMGVMELRQSGWKQRKTVEAGPKKLSEIHKEIAQEQVDLQNQRDNYDRKQSTGIRMGSNSLRRNAPPPSRNSLDSRVTSTQKKAGAAIASKMAVSTAAPRQMSMSMANTSTGLQKKSWKGGSQGGGNANEAGGSRAAWGRNNSSREGSESRKNSTVDEKSAALAAAGAIAGGRRSTSQLSINSQEDESKAKENEEKREKMVGIIASRFDEQASGDMTLPELVGDLFGFSTSERQAERFGSPKIADVFQRFAQCYVDKLKKEFKAPAVEALVLAMQDGLKKPEIIQGLQQFCSWVIEKEMWEDKPKCWELFAELLAGTILFEAPAQNGDDDGPKWIHTALENYSDLFVEAANDPRKGYKFSLLVSVLRIMAESLVKHEDFAMMLAMDYENLACKKHLDQQSLNEALKACRPDVPNFNNLYELLHH